MTASTRALTPALRMKARQPGNLGFPDRRAQTNSRDEARGKNLAQQPRVSNFSWRPTPLPRGGALGMLRAMRSQAEKARALRALHERAGAFLIPNPWDVGTARLLERLGFEAL